MPAFILAEAGFVRQSDGFGGVCEFFGGTPVRGDIIDDQRGAQAVDRVRGKAVPAIGAGDENQPGIMVIRHRGDPMMGLGVIIDIGARVMQGGIIGQVDQHGEAFRGDVAMRF
jgi:hypothetical protein